MKKLGPSVVAVSVVVSVGLLWFGVSKSIQFERGCSGHLKRAADANTIRLAERELGKAVEFIESNQLTSGDTGLLYSLPENELDFWYINLKTSLEELKNTPDDVERLTESNQLIKLRETIMDRGEKRSRVTVPPNAFVYPYQQWYRGFGAIAVSGLLVGNAIWLAESECARKRCRT